MTVCDGGEGVWPIVTVCDGGEGGGLSWRDVTFVIKIHCRGDSVLNCYNCYCAGAATLCEQAQRLYVNRRTNTAL